MPEQKVKLNTGSSLQAFLLHVIDEGIKSALYQKALVEKEKQTSTATKVGGLKNSSKGGGGLFGGNDGSDKNDEGSEVDDEIKKLAHGDVTVDDIVDKLNAIRSGRSFKDSAVSNSMEQYINSLSKSEKTALMAFLKGIAQIVTGEIPADQAINPSDEPADVKMNKTNEPKIVHKKPNVIKGVAQPSGNKAASQEDTTPPTPIIPKRR
jgi:hypothetical protein